MHKKWNELALRQSQTPRIAYLLGKRSHLRLKGLLPKTASEHVSTFVQSGNSTLLVLPYILKQRTKTKLSQRSLMPFDSFTLENGSRRRLTAATVHILL